MACSTDAAKHAGVRSTAGWVKASSRARWTSEPRVVWIDGGSSIFSMLTKRNSIGHDVNASTRLGDRLVGTSYVVTPSS